MVHQLVTVRFGLEDVVCLVPIAVYVNEQVIACRKHMNRYLERLTQFAPHTLIIPCMVNAEILTRVSYQPI